MMKIKSKISFNSRTLVVADVGATGGLHERWSRLSPHVTAVLFDADHRAEFPEQFGIDHIVIPSGLSNKSVTKRINLCRKPQVSSLYEPNFPELSRWTNIDRFTVTERPLLELSTLDLVLPKHNIPRIDFLKIDTQGSELDIMEGGGDSLTAVIGIETEVEFTQLYSDQPVFRDVDVFLSRKGFQLYDLRRTYWKRRVDESASYTDKGKIVFGDALYFREPDELLSRDEEGLLFRTVVCFLAYGYDGIAWYCYRHATNRSLFTVDEREESAALIRLYAGKKSSKRIQALPKKVVTRLIKALSIKRKKSLKEKLGSL